MSRTYVEITFGVMVADSDNWSEAHLAEADAEPSVFYDSWVADKLKAVMRLAGDRFVYENPDLFCGDLA